MIFVYILLVISLILNLFFIKYDLLPYLIPTIRKRINRSRKKIRDADELEQLILSASLSAIKNKKSIMPWNIGGSHRMLVKVIVSIKSKKSNKEFKNYNYPRGYLLSGLSEYLIAIEDNEKLLSLKKTFDKFYITDKGEPLFNLDKVDQSPFGVASMNLYKVFNEEKYLLFAKRIYSFIFNNYSENNLVIYRENSKNELNDTIGMIVPFLVKYYQLTRVNDALNIAINQMQFYIKNGTDHHTFMPSHGVNLKTKIKVGSSNWGRGIGWYFIGLKEIYDLNGSFKNEYEGLSRTIKSLQNEEGLWGQFPGSMDVFDASSSTMFFYCLGNECNKREDILNKLNKYISNDGFIMQTSGDTEGLNFYSKLSGKSELSQGILLMILSQYK
jgi:rhamnogalacturonyl hydrolase YesR